MHALICEKSFTFDVTFWLVQKRIMGKKFDGVLHNLYKPYFN